MSVPNNPLQPDRIDPTRSIQPALEPEEGMPGSFAEYMQSPMAKATGTSAPSPMQLASGTSMPTSGPSIDTMNNVLSSASTQYGDMSTQLQTPGLKIRTQDRDILDKNLGQASDNLRSVNTKLGVDPGPPPVASDGPFGKFLGLINDGTSQIASARQSLSTMAANPDKLNPADMLLVQVKVNQAQQQIEFSSILLSKVVDDFKQLMNIQI